MASATFEVGDRVIYLYDPEIPLSWPHLNNCRGTVAEVDNEEDGFIGVKFAFKPQLGILPCEPAELVKETKNGTV